MGTDAKALRADFGKLRSADTLIYKNCMSYYSGNNRSEDKGGKWIVTDHMEMDNHEETVIANPYQCLALN